MRGRMSSDSSLQPVTTRCGQPLPCSFGILLLFPDQSSKPRGISFSSPYADQCKRKKTHLRDIYLYNIKQPKHNNCWRNRRKANIIVSLKNQCDCPVEPGKSQKSEGGIGKELTPMLYRPAQCVARNFCSPPADACLTADKVAGQELLFPSFPFCRCFPPTLSFMITAR